MARPNNGPRRCTDCGSTEFVEDWHAGDLTCTECGLVAMSHLIDDSAEWNNYQDDGIDRSRVGAPSSSLYTNSSPMSTLIPKTSKTWLMSKIHDHMSISYKDRALNKVYQDIQKVCENVMHLGGGVIDTAKELYKDVKEAKVTRGDNHKAIVACCVYFACKLSDNGSKREKAEVSDAFEIERSLFTQACKIFQDLVKDKPYYDRLFEDTRSSERGIIYRTLRTLPIEDERSLWSFVGKVEDAYASLRVHGDGLLDAKTPHSIICALAVALAPKVKGLPEIGKPQVRECCKISAVTLNKTLALVEQVLSSSTDRPR